MARSCQLLQLPTQKHGLKSEHQILAGVQYGDTLFLFIQASHTPKEPVAESQSRLLHTDFADNISLISDSVEKACKLLVEFECQCLRIGLGMNAKKTKVIAENVENPGIRTLDETVLEVVKDFNYLGAWIASTEAISGSVGPVHGLLCTA